MERATSFTLALLFTALAYGQSSTARNANYGANKVAGGTALPAACTESQLFFKTAATKGIYQCIGSSWSRVASTVASGTATLGTSEIASGACAAAVTVAATGVATTDVISWTPNADIVAVTGYAPVTTGGLAIYPYPTSGNVNFKVCNPTSAAITPGAVTLNWRVAR